MCLLYENAICSLGSPLMKKLFQVQQPGLLRSCLVFAVLFVIRRTPSLLSLPALYLQCPPQPLHLLNHSWQLCSSWHFSLIPNYHLVKKKCGAVASLVLLGLLRGLGRKWAPELRAALCYQGVWVCLFYQQSKSFDEIEWYALCVRPSLSLNTCLKLVHGQDGFAVG